MDRNTTEESALDDPCTVSAGRMNEPQRYLPDDPLDALVEETLDAVFDSRVTDAPPLSGAADARIWRNILDAIVQMPLPRQEDRSMGEENETAAKPEAPEALAALRNRAHAYQVAEARAYWDDLLVSRAAEFIYRKLLLQVYRRPESSIKLQQGGILIAPLSVGLVFDTPPPDDNELREYFRRAAESPVPKLIVQPVYSEPVTSEQLASQEVFSVVEREPFVLPVEHAQHLELFLCPVAGAETTYRLIGLLLGRSSRDVTTVWRLRPPRPDQPPEDLEREPGDPDWRLAIATLPIWVKHLFDILEPRIIGHPAGESVGRPGGQILRPYLPTPPAPGLPLTAPKAVHRSLLPHIFDFIQRTISPLEPEAIGCMICGLTHTGTILSVSARSANYPELRHPDVSLIGQNGFNWRGMGRSGRSGMGWSGRSGMGLTGRSAIFRQQLVARHAGHRTPEPVRDWRVSYADEEELGESAAVPLFGWYEPDSGPPVPQHVNPLEWMQDPQPSANPLRSHNILYICAKRYDLLTPIYVLWLREVAAVLSEYFGIAAAGALRARLFNRDHEVGHRAIIAAVDSERHALLEPLLTFVQGQVEHATAGPAPRNRSAISCGLLFVHLLAEQVELPGWHRRAEASERLALRLRDAVQEEHWDLHDYVRRDADGRHEIAAVPYRGGVLVALRPEQDFALRDLALALFRDLAGWRSRLSPEERHDLSALVFHRAFAVLERIGFLPDQQPLQLVEALRQLDPPLHDFQTTMRENRQRVDPDARTQVWYQDPLKFALIPVTPVTSDS